MSRLFKVDILEDGLEVLEESVKFGKFSDKVFSWLKPQVIEFIKNSKCSIAYDPFVGDGSVLAATRYVGIENLIGLSQVENETWQVNDSLVKIPKVDGAIILTNPPYLAKNSATRKDIDMSIYFDESPYQDLYLIALDKMVRVQKYIVAIIPESFISSNFKFKNLLHSITILEENPFTNTETPVCVVCFDGIRKDSNLELEDFYLSLDTYKSKGPKKTVRDAIGNMPKFRPLDKSYKSGRRNVSHELIGEQEINLHEARYHNKRDIKVFYDWISKNMNSYPTKQKTDYYKKVTGKDTNHNKYRSLEWDKPSPTIVAHLHKDGLMFIHPDINQLRSITVREAALLQSFPLDFEFVGSNAYCFKMIGNAVPVLMAKAIANAIYKVLEVDKREKI